MTLQVDDTRIDASHALLDEIADSNDLEGDALAHWLADTLCAELGLPVLHRDADGDFPVTWGRSTVYVRADDAEPRFVTVLALLLEGFDVTPAVFEAVNAINVQVPFAKTIIDVDDLQIVTSVRLPVVDTLSPRDLLLAIATVADTVDYFDTLLQNRFGGSTAADA